MLMVQYSLELEVQLPMVVKVALVELQMLIIILVVQQQVIFASLQRVVKEFFLVQRQALALVELQRECQLPQVVQ